MKIIPLSEGTFTVDATKQFLPFDAAVDQLSDRSPGSLLVEIQPFALITEKDVLVLDTGLGYTMPDGTLQMHHNLAQAGINPLDVTKVLISHLHKDHAGAIARFDTQLQQQFLTFPNATYIVNRQEMEIAVSRLSSSYDHRLVDALINSSQLQLVESEGIIDDYIRYQWTGAHSPWHQVFWIEENGTTVFFGGDVAPQLVQMKTRFVTKYDFDGKRASELRAAWWLQGQQEGWTFLFYHDIKSPVFKAGS